MMRMGMSMLRCTRSLFVTLAALLPAVSLIHDSPAAPPTTVPADDAAFAARLTAIDAKGASVADLTADFVQQKYSALLRDPIITRGTVRARGSAMLWQSEQPEPTRTRVDTQRLRIFYVKQNVVEEYPIAGKLGTLAASPLPRLATLREQFKIAPDAGDGLPKPADVTDAVALRLDPATDDAKQYLDHVRVLLDASRGLVVAFEVTDPDGERTTIAFSNLRLNANLSDADLELNAPANVKVVKPLEPGK